MHLASSKGVWRCVSGESRNIRSMVVFGGSTQIRSLFVFVSCVFGLDPSDINFSSSTAVAILLRRSYGALVVCYNKLCPAPAREGR